MEIEQLKIGDLRDLAKDMGIKGAETMKKADLISAIEAAEAAPSVETQPVSETPAETEPKANDYVTHPKFDKFKNSGGN